MTLKFKYSQPAKSIDVEQDNSNSATTFSTLASVFIYMYVQSIFWHWQQNRHDKAQDRVLAKCMKMFFRDRIEQKGCKLEKLLNSKICLLRLYQSFHKTPEKCFHKLKIKNQLIKNESCKNDMSCLKREKRVKYSYRKMDNLQQQTEISFELIRGSCCISSKVRRTVRSTNLCTVPKVRNRIPHKSWKMTKSGTASSVDRRKMQLQFQTFEKYIPL